MALFVVALSLVFSIRLTLDDEVSLVRMDMHHLRRQLGFHSYPLCLGGWAGRGHTSL
jgi:hypothetical protein